MDAQGQLALDERQESEENRQDETLAAAYVDARFAEAVAAIRENVLAAKEKKIAIRPQHKLRASGFHPCDRKMYYDITNWKDAAPHTAETQCLFDFGGTVEKAAIEQLEEAGYEVGGQQVGFEQKVANGVITGHIDGWISGRELGEHPLPLEIKGYTFQAERIHSWRDMLDAPQAWLRSVPCQLQMYLLQASEARGVLVMFDKKSATPFPLPTELDLEFAEGLLKRAEDIYEHLELEIEPDRMPYEAAVCGGCPFAHVCQPLQSVEVAAGGEVFDEAHEEHMRVFIETQDAAKQNTAAEKALKAFGKGLGDGEYFIGPAQIKVKTGNTHYNAKAATEAKDVPVTRVTIKPV